MLYSPKRSYRRLNYPGNAPTPATPTLSDVMTTLSQIQQNQQQILQEVGNCYANDVVIILAMCTMLQYLSSDPSVQQQIQSTAFGALTMLAAPD